MDCLEGFGFRTWLKRLGNLYTCMNMNIGHEYLI